MHTRSIKLFNEQRKVIQALRNSVVQHYQPQCVKPMREEFVGCDNRSIPDLFNYLCESFGSITYKDLEKNEEDMKQPWDPDTPIEVIYNRIEEASLIAALGNSTMSEVKKITTAYML